jgi:subtilisin family serine protease
MRASELTSELSSVVRGVSPRLDVIANCSTDVNMARAEQCPFVAGSTKDERAAAIARMWRVRTDVVNEPPRYELLTPAQIRRIEANRPADQPSDVAVSVFVQLRENLAPEARKGVIDTLEDRSRRIRVKGDLAAVEASLAQALDFRRLPGVTYVEPGQSLRAPEPTELRTQRPPNASVRSVGARRRQHHDGAGVLVGIIDVGGFDFAHEDFVADGKTRWVAIWDQGGAVRPEPNKRGDVRFAGFDYGAEIRADHMQIAMEAATANGMRATALEPQSTMTVGSHGTHVASIAAGNRGVARRAHLAGVVVSLGDELADRSRSFYDSTRVVDAVDYLIALAEELGGDGEPLPLSINISLGTNGHAHDSSSAMARWIDNALATPGRCVCVAAGNAGQVAPVSDGDRGQFTGRIHAAGTLVATDLRQELRWMVGAAGVNDVSENEMEIWYSPQDRIDVEVRPPGGDWIGPIVPGKRIRNVTIDNGTKLSVHNETYFPANGVNRISVLLSPFFGDNDDEVWYRGPIASGEWRIRLTGRVIRDGRFDAWIERDDPRPLTGPPNFFWSFPSYFDEGSYTDDRMINTLACAERVVAVANIDAANDRTHYTSSRGPTRDGRFKPDVGADGTDIVAAAGFDPDRKWVSMTGTSMASPFVCGVAALMLAIDRDLTAAQILAMMRTRSHPLVGQDYKWRTDAGFGVIDPGECVAEAANFVEIRKQESL